MKFTNKGKDYGLLCDDAHTVGGIAYIEGIMNQAAKAGHRDTYNFYQSRLRRMYESTFPDEPLPDDLKMGYKPPVSGWSEEIGSETI
jgi:hypothetical protein